VINRGDEERWRWRGAENESYEDLKVDMRIYGMHAGQM